jgi:iron complex transport system permease protein
MSGFHRGRALRLVGLLIVALAVVAVRLLVYRDLQGRLILGWPAPTVAFLRWTAIAVAAIVGVSLAVAGVLLQALLRNPLASPFVLGISSGAALGIMIATYVGLVTYGPAALAGAAVTMVVVYGLGQRRWWPDPLSMLLVGVVVSSICGALILFLHHLVPQGLKGNLLTWMAGSIRQGVPRSVLVLCGVVAAGGCILAARLGRAMDAATLGDDEARSVGLALGPLRLGLFCVAGVLTAQAVALAGPIGFVGLIAPHAGRLLLGPRHGVLVIGAGLIGAGLLIGADAVSQTLFVAGGRMPVGVFTAILGGPLFIWLLRSGRGQA